MATYQMANMISGTTEQPKYDCTGVTCQVWTVALDTNLGATDTIGGPVLPANTFLISVGVDVTDLDTDVSPTVAFEVGTATTVGAFVPTGATTATTGGIIAATVAATTGFTSTVDTPILISMTAAATKAAKGTMTCRLMYTANP